MLTIVSGLYARHELRTVRTLAVQGRHPSNGTGTEPTPAPEAATGTADPPIAEADA